MSRERGASPTPAPARVAAIVIVATAAYAALAAVTSLDGVTSHSETVNEQPAHLPECVTEDDEDCIWDAATRGNGEGVSFIRWDGVTYYAEVNE